MKNLLLVALFVASTVSAQITITSSGIPQNIGDWVVSTADSVSILNVGHEGGPQHWEFQLVNPSRSETTYVRPVGDSPVLDSFPSTNLLYSTVFDTVDVADTVRITHYAHQNLSGSSLSGLGWVLVTDTPSTIITTVYHPPSIELEFPTSYGSTWTSGFSYTMIIDSAANIYNVTIKDRETLIDAWGTVTTPLGTFNTLRQRTDILTITDTYFMDILISSDTSNTVGFNWLVSDYGPIVSVKADSLFQDTLVTTPWCYSLITQAAVSVNEYQGPSIEEPLNIRILGNPTSFPIRIQLEIGQVEKATVEIYDVTGRLINRFDDLKPGIFTWSGISHDGNKVPSGLYIVNIKTPSGTRMLTVSVM